MFTTTSLGVESLGLVARGHRRRFLCRWRGRHVRRRRGLLRRGARSRCSLFADGAPSFGAPFSATFLCATLARLLLPLLFGDASSRAFARPLCRLGGLLRSHERTSC